MTEGAASNIFAVKDGRLLAPPKDNLMLPGITYDVILEIAAANRIPYEVRRIAAAEIFAADHTREEWAEHDKHVAQDGQWPIACLEGERAPAEIRNLPEVQVLKTVWAQQFREAEGKIVYQAGTTYDGHTQIQTPHDAQARYSRKRIREWVGGKVQVTETDDEEYPHIITDIAATCSSKTDYESLVEIQERLKQRHCLPQKQYADSGYMSGPNLATSAQNGIDLIGPTVPVVSKQSKIPNGITTDQFDIDIENLQATCPDGFSVGPDFGWKGKVRFLFPKQVCAACALRERCCTGKGGRTLCVGTTYPLDAGVALIIDNLQSGSTTVGASLEQDIEAIPVTISNFLRWTGEHRELGESDR